ncbi:1-acyl-sn-glycerol-3-phosphate acyltransferase [Vulcanimicrobium alpinum]|uniref:1-acyl-sn-glycerol-3-phosphate acyltransferase n=1 Tax=Vulcanimicrobium alpinum TaxID=3016050 RepID=A0AAN1XW84_UNVUL|nr:lysophospholipid acyltransferase family protein [Vulcanimicrobium alpinum]BDE06130.1 1-acyl-sn-glycerol-3-phosphate acyltransferase [Vulcanimicrobium alpinum]
MSVYAAAKFAVTAIATALFRYRVIGAEKVPRDGGVIIAANHISNFDPPLLGIGVPRPVSYMAKKELFALPVLGPLLPHLNAFPVDRQAGGTAALRASLRMLKEGRCVGIFPEGGRNVSGTNEEKAGAAFLAAASGAPVVPAAIVGTRSLRPFRRITVVFGDPLRIERNRKSDEGDLEKGAAEIMSRIRALEGSIR